MSKYLYKTCCDSSDGATRSGGAGGGRGVATGEWRCTEALRIFTAGPGLRRRAAAEDALSEGHARGSSRSILVCASRLVKFNVGLKCIAPHRNRCLGVFPGECFAVLAASGYRGACVVIEKSDAGHTVR